MPKLYFSFENYIVIEKLNGLTIKEFLNNKKIEKKRKEKILNKIVKICEILDKLKINKFEMTNPYKHIFIEKYDVIKFIDFERCRITNRPKNLNQFKEYIRKQTKILNK
jgi:predicted Ser/Thr protein kinase